MRTNLKDLRWSVEQRLEFIEFRLFWDGQVNRADLVEQFHISVPQASADLTRYEEIARGNLVYDKSRKTYVPGPDFKPQFYAPSGRHYLTQLRLISDGVCGPEATWLGWMPEFDAVPLVRRKVSTNKLQRIVKAMRLGHCLYVNYQSVRRDEPVWRWITPHALGFDGFRWHARAWCHRNEDFRDFVIARLLDVGRQREHEIDADQDLEWHERVTLLIGPHPGLELGARKAIELDFGMTNGVLKITSRACLSWYLERHLGLDLDPDTIPPERQQIVLLNRSEVDAVRARARSENSETAAAEIMVEPRFGGGTL